MAKTDEQPISCSFCGKREEEVRRMIQAPGARICDQCIQLCMSVLEDELKRVWRAIAQLPVKEQQIMRMKYVMEMPDEKIAKEVGLAPSSIRKYIGRAREQIKAIVYTE